MYLRHRLPGVGDQVGTELFPSLPFLLTPT